MTDQVPPSKPTYHERKALAEIKPWLLAEMVAKPARRRRYLEKHNYVESKLLHQKVARSWENVQQLREWIREENGKDALLELRQEVGRTALLACEDARQAYVHLTVAKGFTPAEADMVSWLGLDRYIAQTSAGLTPLPAPTRLDASFEEAINGYCGREDAYGHPVHTYIGTVGFTAVLLSQQTRGEADRSQLIIPPHTTISNLAG